MIKHKKRNYYLQLCSASGIVHDSLSPFQGSFRPFPSPMQPEQGISSHLVFEGVPHRSIGCGVLSPGSVEGGGGRTTRPDRSVGLGKAVSLKAMSCICSSKMIDNTESRSNLLQRRADCPTSGR